MAATPRRGARSARARRRADAARGTQEQTPEAAAVARPEDRARAADAAARTDGAATGSGRFDRLSQHPAVRVGAYAWATLGIIGLLVVAGVVLLRLSLLWIPVLLALFPAALLEPSARWLRRQGLPPAAAALVTLVLFLALVGGVFGLLVPAVNAEIDGLRTSIEQGFDEIRSFLADGPLGLAPIQLDDLVEQARTLFVRTEGVSAGVFDAAVAVVEGLTGLILGLVVLFFYLKDGQRIGAWLRDLFPERLRADVAELGAIGWQTFGAYIRGQLIVALVDAVFIGIGLWILRVPLALPLAVVVFFGGLFPIVGAFLSGTFAVLVALADGGLVIALIVLAIVVGVQQLEGHVLGPVVLGRATEMHPLAVILSLTGGGMVLGVLGAFIAVPIVASVARGIGYIRARVPG